MPVSNSGGISSACRPTMVQWRWLVMVGAHIALIIADGINNSMGVLLVHWKAGFQASTAEVSIVPSLFLAGYFSACLICGTVSRYLSPRQMLLIGGTTSCVGLAVSSFAPTLTTLYVTAGLLTGLGLGTTLSMMTVSIANYFDEYYDIAQSLSSAGSSVGIVIIPPLTQYLVTLYGWRGSCLILGGMAGNVLVCGMLLRPVNSFKASAKEKDLTRGGKDHETYASKTEHHVYANAIMIEEETNTAKGEVRMDMVKGSKRIDQGIDNDGYDNIKQSYEGQIDETKVDGQRDNGKDNPQNGSTKEAVQKGATKDEVQSETTMNQKRSDVVNDEQRNEAAINECQSCSTKKETQNDAVKDDVTNNATKYDRQSDAEIDEVKIHSGKDTQQRDSTEDRERTDVTEIYVDRQESGTSGCERCMVTIRHRLQRFGDVTGFSLLFTHYRFTLLVVTVSFAGLCFSAISNHFILSVIDKGIAEQDASFLLSFFGVGNIVGKVITAIALGRKLAKLMHFYIISVFGWGIAVILLRVPSTYAWFIVVALAVGIFSGANICMHPMVIRQVVGVELIGKGFGVLMIFAGIGSVLGPIISGYIYDETENFDIPFFLFGALMVASATSLLLMGKLKRLEERRNSKATHGLDNITPIPK